MSEFASTQNEKAVGKEWHGTGYPKYDPEIHLPMLKEIFGNGGGVYAYVAASQISRATFYQWKKDHPEFKEQYDISINSGAAIWELLPLEWAKNGVAVNHSYWLLIARQRYKMSVAHLEREEGEATTSSKMEAAWQSLRKGGINPQEFNQIASGLSTESRIAEVDLQKQALEHVKESKEASKEMTDEALKAFMAVMNGAGKVVLNEDKQTN